jgi:hypothetical protein
VCNAASCTGSTAELADTCNGSGTCVDMGTQDCSPYSCGDNACRTNCTSNADCDSGSTCNVSTGTCVSSASPLRRPPPPPRLRKKP